MLTSGINSFCINIICCVLEVFLAIHLQNFELFSDIRKLYGFVECLETVFSRKSKMVFPV